MAKKLTEAEREAINKKIIVAHLKGIVQCVNICLERHGAGRYEYKDNSSQAKSEKREEK